MVLSCCLMVRARATRVLISGRSASALRISSIIKSAASSSMPICSSMSSMFDRVALIATFSASRRAMPASKSKSKWLSMLLRAAYALVSLAWR